MQTLSTALLIETYKKAGELDLDKNFITILEREIERRDIVIVDEKVNQ